ncbi:MULTISPECIES: TetR/AcrR family transcriptional regulator, partial [unclassified Mycobacterium]
MLTDPVTSESAARADVDRRDQILDAANECFAQLGIQRTSVQDVARMAKVSRGT